MKAGETTLSSRPQCGHNSSGLGASRFNQRGAFIIKTDDGRWVSIPRFVAERFSEKSGVAFPRSGVRVEVKDAQDIRPATLMVKVHRGERLSLNAWVKNQRDILQHGSSN